MTADLPDSSPAIAASRTARRERADKSRNRALVLAGAAAAFAQDGVETQMDEIAARAGLAVGTLYRHFPTKEALLLAIVRGKFQEILDLTRGATDRSAEDPFDVLADVLRRRVEAVVDDAAARAVLTSADNALFAEVKDIVADTIAALEVLVSRAQAAGTLREDVDAAAIWTASCGVCAVMNTAPAPWQHHLDIVLHGLRRHPSIT